MTRTTEPTMTEREHHAWGALLKYVEALAIAYRYGRYPRRSRAGKKFDRLLVAIWKLREELNWEYGTSVADRLVPNDSQDLSSHVAWWDKWLVAQGKAKHSDVYRCEEIRRLYRMVIDILDTPPEGRLKLFYPDPDERALFHEAQRAAFEEAVENLLIAAQRPSLPWEVPAVLPLAPPVVPIPEPKADRHAELRAALIENPDQSQAVFVKRCRVHPITVRETRRELEVAGAIPYLAHRHGPAQRTEPDLEEEAA